jgi:hypothetical protein
MELNELKILFDSGALKSVVITNAPMKYGYIIIFTDKVNKDHFMTTQRSGQYEPRVFKSIDAAVANSRKIGFKEMQVIL